MRITKQLNQGTKQLNQGTKQLNQVTKQLNEVTKMTRHTITGPAVIGTLSLMSVCILVLTLSNQGLKVALSQTNTDYQEELKRRDEVLDECHKKYKEEVENVIGDAVNKVKLQQELSGQRELTKGFKLTADELEAKRKKTEVLKLENKGLEQRFEVALKRIKALDTSEAKLKAQIKEVSKQEILDIEDTKDAKRVRYIAKDMKRRAQKEANRINEETAKVELDMIKAQNEVAQLRVEFAKLVGGVRDGGVGGGGVGGGVGGGGVLPGV
ncbi:keratin, type II cytoskeletal I-like isoform X2 [Homarus americanus]|uniref:keratin, type II cytoskeletal I-like isoform X2 n=1 Tax=Homarus americanus TaxID=6706 RepID=UPI001C47DE05|nr:keratin, type II cytoskeletal I-like isoform X2 [Homarus americanus]